MFKIVDLFNCTTHPMAEGRGETVSLVNADSGTQHLELHFNRLRTGGARGRHHRHSVSANIYIIKSGEGTLTIDDKTFSVRADQVVFIPPMCVHSLSNLSDKDLELYEIYAPAGPEFDFEIVE